MDIDYPKVIGDIDDAVTRALIAESFLGTGLVRLERVYLKAEDPNPVGVDTAGVNNKYIYFYLPWVALQSVPKIIGLVLHEAAHYALCHIFRGEGRDHELWNAACDAVINHHLLARNYQLPDGAVTFPWVTSEHSAEQVYAELLKQQEQQRGKGKGKAGKAGQGKPGQGWGNDILPNEAGEADEAEVSAVMEAAAKLAASTTAGSGAAFVDRVLAGLLKPKVSWQQVLRSVLQTAFDKSDYSFRRGNRRFIARGMYLPSLHREALGMLAVGVDTSGSISQEVLRQVAGEITAIVQDCRPAKTVVVYCDAQVSHVEEFAPDEPVELHPKGGGGTAFKPVFDWLGENADEPVCALVYITDTYGNMQELTEPGYPVVWGLTEPVPHFTAPFGRTVEVF